MDLEFIYIKAEHDDITSVIELGEKLQTESMEFEPNLIFNKAEATDHYLEELNNDDAYILIAKDKDKIIGYQYSYICSLDYLEKNNLECVFEAIYVLPEYRGAGVASKLLYLSEDWAINIKKANRIKSTIYVGNKASENMHFKNGFIPYCCQYIKLIEDKK